MSQPTTGRQRILTGYRPTGKLHLGHWFGNLQNMLSCSTTTTRTTSSPTGTRSRATGPTRAACAQFTEEMVLDWVAAGLDPDVCTIYRQSDVPEVAELMPLLLDGHADAAGSSACRATRSSATQITDKDLGNVGFFLYPLLQAADITDRARRRRAGGRGPAAAPRADARDRAALQQHLRRYLVEPKAIIAKEGARVPGTDGRKMSKSYGNAIFISRPARGDPRQGDDVRHRPRAQAQDRPGRPGHLPAAPGPQAHRSCRGDRRVGPLLPGRRVRLRGAQEEARRRPRRVPRAVPGSVAPSSPPCPASPGRCSPAAPRRRAGPVRSSRRAGAIGIDARTDCRLASETAGAERAERRRLLDGE